MRVLLAARGSPAAPVFWDRSGRLDVKFAALRETLDEIHALGLRKCDPAVAFERAHLARDYLDDIRRDLDGQSGDIKKCDWRAYNDALQSVDAVDAYLLTLPRKFRGECSCIRARK